MIGQCAGFLGKANRKNESFIVQDVLTSIPLLIADLIAIATAWLVSSSIENILLQPANFLGSPALPMSLILFPTAYFLLGTYPGVNVSAAHELENVVKATTIASLGMISFLLINNASNTFDVILESCLFFTLILLLVPLCRSVSRKIGSKFHWWRQPTLIVGNDAEVMRIADWLDDAPELGLRQLRPRELSQDKRSYPSHVIFAFKPDSFNDDLLWTFPRTAVLSTDDVFRATTAPERIAALSLIKQQNQLLNPANQLMKRSMDLSIALGVFHLILPLLLRCVGVKIELQGSGFLRAGTVRSNGRRFKVWKFRTMHVDADKVLAKHLNQNEDLRREWEAEHKLQSIHGSPDRTTASKDESRRAPATMEHHHWRHEFGRSASDRHRRNIESTLMSFLFTKW